MKKELVLTLLAVLVSSDAAFADGLPFKGNRYDGAVTVFRMTPDQVSKVKQGRLYEERSREIQLTLEQKSQLQKEAGFGPETIEVWTLEEAKATCSCELLNFGIRVGPDLIEVPHYFLGETHEDRGKFESQVQSSDRKFVVSSVLSVAGLCAIATIFVRSLRARPRSPSQGPSELKAAA